MPATGAGMMHSILDFVAYLIVTGAGSGGTTVGP
jgi:hypothetical protein